MDGTDQKDSISVSVAPNVGEVEIAPNCYVFLTRLPNWWFRLWARILLGWKWTKYPKETDTDA